MTELQQLISEANLYKKEIEEMHVKLAYLSVQIKQKEAANNVLDKTNDDLQFQRYNLENENRDLESQIQIMEDQNLRRLQAKVNRDKTGEIKELLKKGE